MAGVGETLAREALKRGMLLFIDADGDLKYFAWRGMSPGFRRLLLQHHTQLRDWLVTDAVTIE